MDLFTFSVVSSLSMLIGAMIAAIFGSGALAIGTGHAVFGWRVVRILGLVVGCSFTWFSTNFASWFVGGGQ